MNITISQNIMEVDGAAVMAGSFAVGLVLIITIIFLARSRRRRRNGPVVDELRPSPALSAPREHDDQSESAPAARNRPELAADLLSAIKASEHGVMISQMDDRINFCRHLSWLSGTDPSEPVRFYVVSALLRFQFHIRLVSADTVGLRLITDALDEVCSLLRVEAKRANIHFAEVEPLSELLPANRESFETSYVDAERWTDIDAVQTAVIEAARRQPNPSHMVVDVLRWKRVSDPEFGKEDSRLPLVVLYNQSDW